MLEDFGSQFGNYLIFIIFFNDQDKLDLHLFYKYLIIYIDVLPLVGTPAIKREIFCTEFKNVSYIAIETVPGTLKEIICLIPMNHISE